MWRKIDDDRWMFDHPDGSTLYLQRSGERLVELHVNGRQGTIHTYVGELEADDTPLSAATWQSTVEVTVDGGSSTWAWATLAEAVRPT